MIKNINLDSISKLFFSLTCFSVLISTAATNIFLILTIFFSILTLRNMDQVKNIFCNEVAISIIFLYIVFIASYTYTVASDVEAYDLLKKYFKFLYIPILFYIAKTKDFRDLALKYLVYGCTIILILSYLKYFNILNPLDITNIIGFSYQEKLMEGVTVFQHSINHGIILSFVGFVSFILAKKDNNLFFYIISVCCFVNTLLLNDSRSGYLISTVLITIIFYQSFKDKKITIFAIFLAITISSLAILSSDVGKSRILIAIDNIVEIKNYNYQSSLGYRYIWFINGLNNFKENPIFGYGVGSYKKTIQEFIKDKEFSKEHELELITQNPHNEFISIATQTGGIGLAIFLFFLYILIKKKYDYFNIAILSTILISCLFNSAFYDNILGIFSILIISLMNKQSYKKEN